MKKLPRGRQVAVAGGVLAVATLVVLIVAVGYYAVKTVDMADRLTRLELRDGLEADGRLAAVDASTEQLFLEGAVARMEARRLSTLLAEHSAELAMLRTTKTELARLREEVGQLMSEVEVLSLLVLSPPPADSSPSAGPARRSFGVRAEGGVVLIFRSRAEAEKAIELGAVEVAGESLLVLSPEVLSW